MKIEMMKYLSDEISDINLLKKLIETLCDKSPEEVTKIVNELKKCDYDEDACEIATNPDVLDKRTIEEQIQLMKALKECDYNFYACEIAINPDVLDKRTIEEQIQLMKALKECDYSGDAFCIAINPDVLDKRTTEEQIQLMKALKECDYAEDACEIATNPDVLDKRTIEEQIQLMKKSLSKKVCHFDNIENILTISEIKEYIEKLEEELGKDEDIKLYTKVSKYNKKKRKKLIFLKSKN